ncbi:MAG: peptidoglycan-associated lipoprotein Pal [Geobacter sp.]|nr:peptidoglycan-associated lipoprotein Pal [Geobacter sp.]
MRKGGVVSMVLLCAALVVSGCAKKEVVKTEEPLAPTTPPAAAKPVEPETKPVIKEEPVREQPIKEAAVKEEPAAAQPMAELALAPVYFDFDAYVLTQTTRDILYKNAEWLLKNRTVKVQIEGHCDERGSDEYNMALGEKRAKSALNYLVTVGVPAENLSTISYGEEKPADPGHEDAAWAKNRRAEFTIISR